jgi:hypothetical protein
MSLDTSISDIRQRLLTWAAFPKYQLERRVDIFLTPFLECFLRDRLRGSVALVAPEFPLLARLKGAPAKPGARSPGQQTVNVDYLLHVTRKAPAESAWVFLELKTDGGSLKPDQHRAYASARDVGMRELRKQLGGVKKASRKPGKYSALIRHLDDQGLDTDRIEIVYLTPEPHAPFLKEPKRENPTTVFSLKDFASQSTARIPVEHRDLWSHVKKLLLGIESSAGARDTED